MKSLVRVKEEARKFRAAVLSRGGDLFIALVEELKERGYKVRAVDKGIIRGAEAELSVAEKKIRYDAELNNDPAKRLLVVAHEAGHVILHKYRLEDRISGVDPLSPYFNTGGPALARYNRRSREEIEADAFANEFVCPSDEVFAKWLADPSVTSVKLADEYSISPEMILSRLAEALFEQSLATAATPPKEPGEAVDDEEQKKAASHFGSPALVNAGPGTGKTATLIERTSVLLREKGADPNSLLMLTFSNEAAEELRARIEREFGPSVADQIEITTFHGFGHASLLKWNSDLDKEFIVLDESRQEELVFDLLGKIECDPIFHLRDPLQTARDCVRQITKLKEKRISPTDLEGLIVAWEKDKPDEAHEQRKSRALLAVYRAYEAAKDELSAVDFPDLINRPLLILESKPELVEALRNKFKWVMVDEYQDVSLAVAQLLGKICGPGNPPWVVGDLRQAIYVFCGAAPQNVTNFPLDFDGAEIFELRTNYRSCDEVIELANQLATIMNPNNAAPADGLWKRGSNVSPLGGEELTVKVAQASSDAAEYDGIACQVEEWLKMVDPQDIAVLARRNKDVRKVAVELSRRGIKVITPGLISSDGAAGLLACISAHIDGRKASLPRAVYALGAGRYDGDVVNRVIELLSSGTDVSAEPDNVKSLIAEVDRLEEGLEAARSWSDAFSMVCLFLFDSSDYLRRVLTSEDEARRSIEISEILSALAWAISYRYSHPKVPATDSRIGFAQFFRGILAEGRPALVPPQPIPGAVQVMTCHASKGLEFPCVAVTGQTRSLANDVSWLPPGIESEQDDRAQGNSLLFVGATRAKRSLLISYAKTPRRQLPELLGRWIERHGFVPATWERVNGDSESFTFGAIWGFPTPTRRISATSMEKDWCGMKVYLQDIYGGRFPTVADTLYPQFFAATRRAIAEILMYVGKEAEISEDDAQKIFVSHFDSDKYTSHPLYERYRRRGISYAVAFAAEKRKLPRPAEIRDADNEFGGEIGGSLLALRFGLTAYFGDDGGGTNAIIFRPEPIDVAVGANEMPWSKLKKGNGTALLMLRNSDPGVSPWVFSGEDGLVYELKWKRKTKSSDDSADAEAAAKRLHRFSSQQFDGKASDFNCETRCDNRSNCPYWMNLNMLRG